MALALARLPIGAVRHVVNHDIMNCTANGVVSNHLYSGRALGMSEPRDWIQMHRALKPLWPDIRSHYRRVGLRHSENVIWDLDLSELARHAGFKPSVFYFGANECRAWGDHQWFETVEFINSKNNFVAMAHELGVDVPATWCFDSVQDIDPGRIGDDRFPCYLKAAVSVAGVGIHRCADRPALMAAMQQFAPDVPVQIQEEVRAEGFLNLQYRVVGGELQRLLASEQILAGFSHQGNRVPAPYQPWFAVEPMARWLRDQGMQGVFAFDVAVVQTARGLRFPAIECNPRFNGASYPTLMASKLGIREWRAITVPTRHRSLAALDLSGIEFDPVSRSGVILVNWGTVLEGKLVVLLAGSPAVQTWLQSALEPRL